MNPIVRMMKRYINMPLKKALPLLFISALVLASTGCTSNTASPTPTATAAATTHDAFLERLITAWGEDNRADTKQTVTKWGVTWTNDSSVTVELATRTAGETVEYRNIATFTMFSSADAATEYIEDTTRGGSPVSTTFNASWPISQTYLRVAGHKPAVFAEYKSGLPIYQYDGLVISTEYMGYNPTATATPTLTKEQTATHPVNPTATATPTLTKEQTATHPVKD